MKKKEKKRKKKLVRIVKNGMVTN